jgi:hypothetical protein
MKLRSLILTALALFSAASLALAQSGIEKSSGEQYVPRLGDIMNLIQVRHAKLWFAGQAQNWELAAFEIGQLRSSLSDAAVFYSGLPVGNVTTLGASIEQISGAIAAKDGKRFAAGFGELSAGCNACHSSMDRAFIVIRPPTDKMFGNQVFQPQGRK